MEGCTPPNLYSIQATTLYEEKMQAGFSGCAGHTVGGKVFTEGECEHPK